MLITYPVESIQNDFDDASMHGYVIESDNIGSYNWTKTTGAEAGPYHPQTDASPPGSIGGMP